jgi:hypothetical protein
VSSPLQVKARTLKEITDLRRRLASPGQTIGLGPIRRTQQAPAWQTTQRVRFGSGGRVARVPVFLRLLTIKVHDRVIVTGTGEAGINVKWKNIMVRDTGAGTIAVKESDA